MPANLPALRDAPPGRFRVLVAASIAGALLGLGGCRCADCDDDDPAGLPPGAELWRETGIETDRPIIGVHASPSEVFAFSESEFVRAVQDVDDDTGEASLRLVDRRRFRTALRRAGQPAVNDLVFARGALDTETGEQVVEFQTVQNAGGVAQVVLDSVRIDSTFDEPVALVSDGREIGAFTRDGRVYAQPIVRRAERSVALLLLGIDYDRGFERFASVEPLAVVDLPGVREDDRAVSSISLLDGYFYVATKSGGFRVTRDGDVERVIDAVTGVRDFFKFEGSFYASREGRGSLLESEDGLSFRSSELVQDFGVVEVLGEDIVVQRFEGWPFFVTDALAEAPDSLSLNRGFTRAQDAYYGIGRLNGRYYLGLDRALYVADSLATTEAP